MLTGIVALLAMRRSVCAYMYQCFQQCSTGPHSGPSTGKKKKVFNCSYGRQHQLWLAFVMQNSGKKSTQGGWELGRIFGPSFVWGRLVSGMVIRVTADDAWEDAAVSSSVVRENCTSVSELDHGVDWDWDEPDLV